jgi:RHS repeat-associated protein
MNQKVDVTSGITSNYSYLAGTHAVSRIDMTGNRRVDFEYDDYGKMTAKKNYDNGVMTDTDTYSYNVSDVLTSIITGEYNVNLLYDAGGQRIRKTTREKATNIVMSDFIYVSGFYTYDNKNNTVNKHISDGSYVIATKFGNVSANTLYYHQNHIGSTAMLTKQDGTVLQSLYYKPYGETWVTVGTPTDDITRLFTGQEYDKETGMYYMNARYYDPSLAVFICPDPAMSGANHYGYCDGNPVMFNDPTGMMWGSENYAASHYEEKYSYAGDGNGGNGVGGGGGGMTDTDHDGYPDIKIDGNTYRVNPETGEWQIFTDTQHENNNSHWQRCAPPELVNKDKKDESGTPNEKNIIEKAIEWYNNNHQAIGFATTIVGIAQIVGGVLLETGGNGTGAALTATGVGAPAGVPIIVVCSTTGAGLITGGAITAAAGLAMMMGNGGENSNLSLTDKIKLAKEKVNEIMKKDHSIELSNDVRIDFKGRDPLSRGHYNKTTKETFDYPHVHDPKSPGGVRSINENDYLEIYNKFYN